jgi:hypothetical protein
MIGRDFLPIGRELLQGGTEAHRRAAAGRAYYALFLEARDALQRWGIAIPRRDPIHAAVRMRFTFVADPLARSVGEALEQLVQLRNQADYILATPGLFGDDHEAQQSLIRAEDAIHTLDLVEADTARLQAVVADIRSRCP